MRHLSRLVFAAAFFAVALVLDGASVQCTAPTLGSTTAQFTLIMPSYPIERRTATIRSTLRVLSTPWSLLKRYLHLASCQLPKLGVAANALRHRSDVTSENTQQPKSSFHKGGIR
jgi:cytosine/uracil/thiamine/allantoin permease